MSYGKVTPHDRFQLTQTININSDSSPWLQNLYLVTRQTASDYCNFTGTPTMLIDLICKGNSSLQYDIYCESLLTLLPAYLPSATYTGSTEPLSFLLTSAQGPSPLRPGSGPLLGRSRLPLWNECQAELSFLTSQPELLRDHCQKKVRTRLGTTPFPVSPFPFLSAHEQKIFPDPFSQSTKLSHRIRWLVQGPYSLCIADSRKLRIIANCSFRLHLSGIRVVPHSFITMFRRTRLSQDQSHF